MHVAVTCPACRRGFCISGRGRCRCGVYLIHHVGNSTCIEDEKRTWLWVGGGPRTGPAKRRDGWIRADEYLRNLP